MDLPVLSPKDIDDVQNFACKNNMDYIAASFVQVGGRAAGAHAIPALGVCLLARGASQDGVRPWRPGQAVCGLLADACDVYDAWSTSSCNPVAFGFVIPSARTAQTADDVRMIRRVLNEAGGQHIKIISKIENQVGLWACLPFAVSQAR